MARIQMRLRKRSIAPSQTQKKKGALQAKSNSMSQNVQDQSMAISKDSPLARSGNILKRMIERDQQQAQGETPQDTQPKTPLAIQAKLEIGDPQDSQEHQADNVARQVVRSIGQTQRPRQSLQRQVVNFWNRPRVQRDGSGIVSGAASPAFESKLQRARGGGQPLPPNFRSQVEPVMGADFSGVRVHTDTQSNHLNQTIQAKAFTTGQDVFFKRGAYNPGSQGGQELIAHELTHVMQQGGAKPPTAQRKEAKRSQSPEKFQTRVGSSSSPIVQRYADFTSRLNGLEPAPKNDVDPDSAKRTAFTALQGYLGSQNGAIVVKGSNDREAWATEKIIESSNEQLEAGGSFVMLKQGSVFSKQNHLNTAYNQELPDLYKLKPVWNPREEAQSKENVHYRAQQQNLGNPVPSPEEERKMKEQQQRQRQGQRRAPAPAPAPIPNQDGSDVAPLPQAPLPQAPPILNQDGSDVAPLPQAPLPQAPIPKQQEIRHVELDGQQLVKPVLDLWKDCRKSSGAVMGSQLEREIRYDLGTRIKKFKNEMPSDMLTQINFDLLTEWFKTHPPNQEEAKTLVRRLMPPDKPLDETNVQEMADYNKRLKKWQKRNKNNISADDAYFELDDQDEFNKQYGLGKYALPDVGEGYVIISGQRATDFDVHHKHKNLGKGHIFPYHWGGVVAQDGNDRLTLEAASEGDEHSIKEGWTFELYGTEEGQSFHEKHGATGRYGNLHQTLRVYKPTEKKKPNQLEAPVMGGGGFAPMAPLPGNENNGNDKAPLPPPLPQFAPMPPNKNDLE